MKQPTLRAAVEWIVANDDVDIPDGHKPLAYLSGVVSIALVADLFGVQAKTVARMVRTRKNYLELFGRDV